MSDCGRGDWRALYGTSAEAADYFRACEEAPLETFDYAAAVASEGGSPVMGLPTFTGAFRYDMGLSGTARWWTEAIHQRVPKLVALPVYGAGSPHSDELALGISPCVACDPARRAAAFGALLDSMEAHARSQKIEVVFLKDVTDAQAAWADPLLSARGFSRLATLPVAHLPLPFASEEDYVASLSSNMRSNLRRKLKRAGDVEVEIRSEACAIESELAEMRQATQNAAKTNYGDFEDLAPGYYDAVLRALPDAARLLLYRKGGKLIGFSLVLLDDQRLTYKYTGMRYPEARDHNLYFINWMTMVRLCFERGIQHLHAGETTYLTKTRLGCVVERSWIYFKHTNRLVNPLFKAIGPRIRIDQMDADVKALGETMPYVAPDARDQAV
ncbi:MAG: GNAT family N-acetyltransferase [Pseudomonadota bacterium]